MGGREYFSVITVGDTNIYQVTGVPAFVAPQGSLALRSDTAALYQNTDGATTWTLVGGGSGGLPFVATNEWYVDATAAASASDRIFPTVEAALDDADSVLAATETVLIRLREGQVHVWDMSTGAAADGTRSLLFYGHGITIAANSAGFAAPVRPVHLSLTGTLAASITTPTIQFTNLNLIHATTMSIPGPWECALRACTFSNALIVELDKSLADVGFFMIDCDGYADLSGFPAPAPFSLSVTAGAFFALVDITRSRIETGGDDPYAPMFAGGTGGLSIFQIQQSMIFGLYDGIEPTGFYDTGESSAFIFMDTKMLVSFGTTATLFSETGVGVLTAAYVDFTVQITTPPFDSSTALTWGSRTDGENALGLPPNCVRILRSVTIGDGLPLDAPMGCLADDMGVPTGFSTTWIKQGDPVSAVAADPDNVAEVWKTANQGNVWTASTGAGSPDTVPMARFNSGSATDYPVRIGIAAAPSYYRVFAEIQVDGPNGISLIELEGLVEVDIAGTVTNVAPPVMTAVIDTSGGLHTATLTPGVGVFELTVDQGAPSGTSTRWSATTHITRGSL